MKRFLSVAIAVCMIFSSLAITAFAGQADVDLAQKVEGTYNSYITIEEPGTTVVLGDLTISGLEDDESAININAENVTLEIAGEVALTGGTGGAGIYVAENASVTIKGAGGTLTATGNNGTENTAPDTEEFGGSGIGGTRNNGASGVIVIDGAEVTATGYGLHAAGIGAANSSISKEITIKNGAKVTAQGGYYVEGGMSIDTDYADDDPEGGPGIGGGCKTCSAIEAICISDSEVYAYGGQKSAGIGAGFWCSAKDITISQSKVTARGGASAAAIGVGRYGSESSDVYANIKITDSVIDAVGGYFASAIGNGYNTDSLKKNEAATTKIDIVDSDVTATGGAAAAAIGGGYKSNDLDIDIDGKTTIDAKVQPHPEKADPDENSGNAIGSGANGSGSFVGSKVDIEPTVIVTVETEGTKPAIEETYISENGDETPNTVVPVYSFIDVTYISGNEMEVSTADVADTAYVTFEETDDERVYDIAVSAKEGYYLNRFSNVDFAFVNNSDTIDYEILPREDGTNSVNGVVGCEDRYEFHFDGENGIASETGGFVVIGQVKFLGYGNIDFAVANESTNEAHGAELEDSIVKHFIMPDVTSDNANATGILNIENAFVTGIEIEEATATLTVNIEFNNAITAGNSADYNDMTVSVTGSNGKKYIGKIGKESDTVDVNYEDDASYVTFEFTVPVGENGYTYTVAVSGAGYRTARKTKLATADTSYDFWNNVKDELGADYLAGDIVKDNSINIYDLSAVVSYFGSDDIDTSAYHKYAKYDLNRDGKIDSKDVAYVLVSWGK